MTDEELEKIEQAIQKITEIWEAFEETFIEAMQPIIEAIVEFVTRLQRVQFTYQLAVVYGLPWKPARFLAWHWPVRLLPELDPLKWVLYVGGA